MVTERLREILAHVESGQIPVDKALSLLRTMPFEEVGDYARLDHHRPLRTGMPEVVFGAGKTGPQIGELLKVLAGQGGGALATRVDADKAALAKAIVPEAEYDEVARALVVRPFPEPSGRGTIAVISAGTSDEPVAAEADLTAQFLGHKTHRVADIGVAGLPRLLASTEALRKCEVVIAVAGMEGALPSVLAGLIDRPIIAVPASVGYGVGIGGYVAMMAMLAGCAPGVTVVNIDNGFGAAVVAARMNRDVSAQ